jgi:hypothetical protein
MAAASRALTGVTVICRKMSPTPYSCADRRTRLDGDDPLVALLMAKPHIRPSGSDHDFAEPV